MGWEDDQEAKVQATVDQILRSGARAVSPEELRGDLVWHLRALVGLKTPVSCQPLCAVTRWPVVAWDLLAGVEGLDPRYSEGVLLVHARAYEGAQFRTSDPGYRAWRDSWEVGAYCGWLRYVGGRVVERQRFEVPVATTIAGKREVWQVPLDTVRELRQAIHDNRDAMARLMQEAGDA